MDRRLYSVETPCYVVDEKRLIENLEILKDVAIRAGCKILLAQKAFSMFSVYPLIGRWMEQLPVVYLRQSLAMKRWVRKPMFFRRHIWKRNLMRLREFVTIWKKSSCKGKKLWYPNKSPAFHPGTWYL